MNFVLFAKMDKVWSSETFWKIGQNAGMSGNFSVQKSGNHVCGTTRRIKIDWAPLTTSLMLRVHIYNEQFFLVLIDINV